ncbi:MAG: threonine--tRNA ligase [Candidatus Latescibacteria bacterium]|jgi:threonyl-tRNA synthetase|nr:threonine--tRNA ligase [Candidatus Latescibacterota bacterium]
MPIKITLPDGSIKEVDVGTTVLQVAESIGVGLARAALAGKVGGTPVDLNYAIQEDSNLEILTFSSDDGKEVYWHSTAHILAQAVQDLFPDAKVTIGPPIENGFYYDFDIERPFTPDELEKIEVRMLAIAKENQSFEREEVSRDEAAKRFGDLGEFYKLELLDAIASDETVSIYKNADKWYDLCRGPHVPSTGRIKSIKLLSSSGAYWRGDEKNKMLQRIYGISFPDKKELQAYLDRIEEAKRRDHRVLGTQLDLFSVNDKVGPGLVLWHPKGMRVRAEIEDFWRQAHYQGDYDIVGSPHIGRSTLWETSGHLDFYRESMYSAMDIDGQEYFAKPMNCPFHSMIYKSSMRSYRDLPFRWAEMGTVYRYEAAGALHGLMRVRGFTQDDAHIFCRPDQVDNEITQVIDFTLFILRSFGFEDFTIDISTRPDKYVGDPKDWDMATAALTQAVEAQNLSYGVDDGGGAFYGPKIDVKIKDALGREWQCSTIQFDFNLPDRFDLSFVGQDGKHHRPYMVHRALLGSMERFFGVLVEHYAGNFPVWLAPVQVAILPVSDPFVDYATDVAKQLKAAGIRVDVDDQDAKLGYKIREAEVQKVPYMLIVGGKEVENSTVAVRRHGEGDLGALSVTDLISRIQGEIENKQEISLISPHI